ncbi:ABC-three component system middle component 4 [Shewanella algae]|uniref:ABC-three component system middle component 4 n=1 Tax=Shewanella algae TaxID=38313 RepID=UPI00119F4601|nr:ABC-three component system middle component 4 [Shewanella algae]TWO85018.1 hypothetical protein AYI75_07910 [Shewanella algae]
MRLSFPNPDNDLHLNLAIILLIISSLGITKRGAKKLNNERIHIYHFLVKNPVKLNQVMEVLGKKNFLICHQESYSVASISANVDPLFDRESLKSLLTILISQELVSVEYKKNDGFVYELTPKGKDISKYFKEDYFTEIQLNCIRLQSTLNVNKSNLNNALGQIMRMDGF